LEVFVGPSALTFVVVVVVLAVSVSLSVSRAVTLGCFVTLGLAFSALVLSKTNIRLFFSYLLALYMKHNKIEMSFKM